LGQKWPLKDIRIAYYSSFNIFTDRRSSSEFIPPTKF
jgi:hypothetical protein